MKSADSMTQIRPVEAARGTHGPIVDGEDRGIALAQWTASARPGFSGCFPLAGAHPPRSRFPVPKQEDGLEREEMFAIQVLVQTAIVVDLIPQQQRRAPLLTGGMTDFAKLRKAFFDSHGGVPSIGDRREVGIERLARPSNPHRAAGS